MSSKAHPRRASCTATISAMRAQKNGSMAVRSCSSSALMPRRRASAAKMMRSAVGRESAAKSSSSESAASSPFPSAPKPARPVSRERRAFPSASSKVRPTAMTSPTAFMRVVSVSSAPWNFSKAKRGAFTTQ